MMSKTHLISLALLTSASMFGCASTPAPPELVDARAAYARATQGPTRELVPADLETARQAVEKAEKSYADDPGAQRTKDLAYIASRKVLTAEARGRRAANEKAKVDAEAQFRTDAASKLDSKNAQIQGGKQALNATTQALTAEQQARQAAEKRAKDAMDRLSALAAVKEDTRGTVITLSGSVLFVTNKADLLPGASERLNQVADALKESDRDVTIFGFTDSQGADDYNQKLSEKRAESVRTYLLGRGIAADRIKAVGKGKADPVGDNKTTEGRANNRRVEIVLAPAPPEAR